MTVAKKDYILFCQHPNKCLALLFVRALENEISKCKIESTNSDDGDFMQQSARSKTFQNFGSILLMKLSLQVSFGSYLNSLFKTTIVSFILQFLTHNSPEHGCDALNCTL